MTAPADVLGNGGAARLKEILGRYPGRDAVHVITVSNGERKDVRLPGVTVDKADDRRLHAELKEWLGGPRRLGGVTARRGGNALLGRRLTGSLSADTLRYSSTLK